MSFTTQLQVQRIEKYAHLLKEIYDLQVQVDFLREELNKLAVNMSQDDINEANLMLKRDFLD